MVCSRRCSTLWRRGRAAQSPVGGCGTGPSLCQEEIQELPCAIRLGLTLPGVHSSSLDPYPTPTPYQVGPHPAGRAARARRPALLGYTPWLGSRAGSAAHLHTCTGAGAGAGAPPRAGPGRSLRCRRQAAACIAVLPRRSCAVYWPQPCLPRLISRRSSTRRSCARPSSNSRRCARRAAAPWPQPYYTPSPSHTPRPATRPPTTSHLLLTTHY